MAETKTAGRVVRHLSTAYFEPFRGPDGTDTVLVRTARRGEIIDPDKLAKGELARLDGLGALMPEGADPRDADQEQQAILDLYRGQRGDVEALARAMERARQNQEGAALLDAQGGITDLSGEGNAGAIGEGNVGRLADHITANKLTVDDTVALAGNDPELAKRVLEAERLASNGAPRAGVEAGLQKITG